MGRIVTAHVELADGRDFVAEIANLTPHSLFVHTAEQLSFRAPVTVTFFSVSIRAELAIVTREPAGWVVVFDADAETRARIEARSPGVAVIGASVLDEETLHPFGPGLESSSLRDALQSTGGIPAATTDPRPIETAAMEPEIQEPISEIKAQELLASQEMPAVTVPKKSSSVSDFGVPRRSSSAPDFVLSEEGELEEPSEIEGRTMPAVERPQFEEEAPAKSGRPRAIPHARTVRMRPTPVRTNVPARTPRRRDMTRREEPPVPGVHGESTSIDLPAMNGSVLTDIPVLADDESTVVFSSTAQYLLQHRTNIAHGAIVVRSRPIPIGTEKTLHLSVPGVDELYTLQAKVILSTDDSIGLSIDHFDEHAAALEAMAH